MTLVDISGSRVPQWTHNFLILLMYFGNLAKIVGWHHGDCPPLLVDNTGSTTDA